MPRMPNCRYLGDGVYAGHDGFTLFLETPEGRIVTNRIALENSTLQAMNEYISYANAFFRTGQHLPGPECEDCGADINDPYSPLKGALSAEVYQMRAEDTVHEVRLCKDCARYVDGAFLLEIIARRASPVYDE